MEESGRKIIRIFFLKKERERKVKSQGKKNNRLKAGSILKGGEDKKNDNKGGKKT